LWLNLLVISALVRGNYRRYPFVFAYALALLVSTVVEIALQAAPRTVQDGYYWIDEVVLDVLVFCVVIAFIDEAARHSKQKVVERHWLVLAAALICASCGRFCSPRGPPTGACCCSVADWVCNLPERLWENSCVTFPIACS